MNPKTRFIATSRRRGPFMAGVSKSAYLNLTEPAIVNTRYQEDGNTAIIDIDGFIGRDLLREVLTGEKSKNTVENIRGVLREISSEKIIVNINSPGGDLNDGLVIYDMLKSKRAEIITNIMGFSASAATLIAQAGTVRRQSREAFQLIHRVMFGVVGYFNQNTMKEITEDAQTIDPVLMNVYASGSSLTADQVAHIMDEGGGYGRWMDADEALENGLIDEIYDASDQDDNTDRLEPEDRAQMKRNVQSLARAGATSASNTDRQARLAEIERFKKKHNDSAKSIPVQSTGVKHPHVKDTYSARMACHEAGHAIIGVALGEKVTELELFRRPDGGRAGSCLFERGDTEMRNKLPAWKYVAVSVAGSVADYGWDGKYMKDFDLKDLNGDPDNSGSDNYHVNKLLENIPPADREKVVSNGIYFAASRLIRNWNHVKDLADRLNVTGSMNANEFNRWFNSATKYSEFHY